MNTIKTVFDKLYIKNVWDVLTLAGIASIFLWVFAKAFGWI